MVFAAGTARDGRSRSHALPNADHDGLANAHRHTHEHPHHDANRDAIANA
jgi:hypothetical protein